MVGDFKYVLMPVVRANMFSWFSSNVEADASEWLQNHSIYVFAKNTFPEGLVEKAITTKFRDN